MEFPRESDTGKYCPDLMHYFVFIAALMQNPKHIGNHLFSKVKFRKPDKQQADLRVL